MSKYGGAGGSWRSLDAGLHSQLVTGSHRTRHLPIPDRVVQFVVPDFTPRVHAGMDVLDVATPGWQTRLDPAILDLEDEDRCVLGQTWPGFKALAFDGNPTAVVGANNFEKMAIRLAAEREGAYDFASTIGCCLDDDDHLLINVQAKRIITEQRGEVFASSPDGCWAMSRLAVDLIQATYSALTETWIREINEARAAGRWPERLVIPGDTPAQAARELLTV